MQRKRKTKHPCPVCFLHKERCLCSEIPRLDLQTRLSLIVHAKELKRTTNTGRLAIQALKNSEMFVRGLGRESLDLSKLIDQKYQCLFFFPAATATELTPEFVQQFDKPIHLLVPDGNWRQASKVQNRHPELAGIPRVKISTPNAEKQKLRVESTQEGMATLQAIAMAMWVLEGEEVFHKIMKLYQLKLSRTLEGRGEKSL
jgi:DTW domain-containing protein YfiP